MPVLGGSSGAETLLQTYDAGAGESDQTMTATAAKGAIVIKQGAGFADTIFKVVNSAGSLNLLEINPAGLLRLQIATNDFILYSGGGDLDINATNRTKIRSSASDSSSAKSLWVTTANAWVDPAARLATFQTNNVEKAYVNPLGNVGGAYFTCLATAAKPTASSTYRGTLYVEQGGGGVADVAFICLKDSGGSYSWVQIS